MSKTVVNEQQFTSPIPSIDRRYPIRRWTANLTGTGDTSGGTFQLVCRFRSSTPSGLIYSHEGLECYSGGSTGSSRLFYGAWRRFTTTTPSGTGWQFTMSLTASPERAMGIRDHMTPVILGVKPTAIAEITIQHATNTDGAVHRALLWGYIWRPASYLSGGLLRPGDYPYSLKV